MDRIVESIKAVSFLKTRLKIILLPIEAIAAMTDPPIILIRYHGLHHILFFRKARHNHACRGVREQSLYLRSPVGKI